MISKKKEIKILINGQEYNMVKKIEHVFGVIFELNLGQYQFMSIDAIKQHMINIIELVTEIATDPGDFLSPKFTITMQKSIKFMQNIIDNVTDKNIILVFITNLILTQEKIGLIPGFGCAKMLGKKVSSRLKINPERQRITIAKL